MIIKKEYKFYASHRNQELQGSKCARPHGHDYKIFLHFNVVRNGNITTLFDDFDKVLEPMFKDEFDHRMLIDASDPLLKHLRHFESESGSDLGLKVLDYATSVENLCYCIFHEIKTRFDFRLIKVEIQETRSSTVAYSLNDYLDDKDFFNNK